MTTCLILFLGLPRLCIEVLHGSKEEMDAAQSKSICQLVLDWIHSQWLEDQKLSLETLAGKKHLLYLGKNNTMQDCDGIEEGSANDSDIIKDYKKVNQQMPKSGKKVGRPRSYFILLGIPLLVTHLKSASIEVEN